MPNAELVLHPPRGRPATFSCAKAAPWPVSFISLRRSSRVYWQASELSRKRSWSVAQVDEALAEFGARMKRISETASACRLVDTGEPLETSACVYRRHPDCAPRGCQDAQLEPESKLLRIRRKGFRCMLAAAQAGEIKVLFNSFSDKILIFI